MSVLRYSDEMNVIQATLFCRTRMLPITFMCTYLTATSLSHPFSFSWKVKTYRESVIHLFYVHSVFIYIPWQTCFETYKTGIILYAI